MYRELTLLVEFLHILNKRSAKKYHADSVRDDHQSVEDIGDVPCDIECCDASDEGNGREYDSVCQCDVGALCEIFKSFLTIVFPTEDGGECEQCQ